jgi:hypothetical protein
VHGDGGRPADGRRVQRILAGGWGGRFRSDFGGLGQATTVLMGLVWYGSVHGRHDAPCCMYLIRLVVFIASVTKAFQPVLCI